MLESSKQVIVHLVSALRLTTQKSFSKQKYYDLLKNNSLFFFGHDYYGHFPVNTNQILKNALEANELRLNDEGCIQITSKGGVVLTFLLIYTLQPYLEKSTCSTRKRNLLKAEIAEVTSLAQSLKSA